MTLTEAILLSACISLVLIGWRMDANADRICKRLDLILKKLGDIT